MSRLSRISKDMRPKFLRVIIAILIFIAIFIFCTVYFRKNIVPTVMDSSIAQVRAITTNAINLAATTVINGGLTYDELFEVKKDNNGKITMIQANSPRTLSHAKLQTLRRQISTRSARRKFPYPSERSPVLPCLPASDRTSLSKSCLSALPTATLCPIFNRQE